MWPPCLIASARPVFPIGMIGVRSCGVLPEFDVPFGVFFLALSAAIVFARLVHGYTTPCPAHRGKWAERWDGVGTATEPQELPQRLCERGVQAGSELMAGS